MFQITSLLDAAAAGDQQAATGLLPLVYNELRRLASARMSQESADHLLDATELVHEVYLRLVGPNDVKRWQNRAHFFAAASEAMRRILVDSARRRTAHKRGGKIRQEPLREDFAASYSDSDLVAVNDVIDQLTEHNSSIAELVKLHVFVGLTLEQAAEILGVSPRTIFRNWAYAKAWMIRRLGED